jgi:hypothetical protein
MTPSSLEWAFCAVDGVNVQCPRALENGVSRKVGKTYDPSARVHLDGYALAEPTRYSLSKKEAAGLRAFFAKALRAGHLLPADASTAAAFGLPFAPAAAPAAPVTSDG